MSSIFASLFWRERFSPF